MELFLFMFFLLFFVAFLGVPIAFALGGSAAVVLFISGVPPTQYPLALWGGTQSFTMLAIPLFVFVGGIMAKSKIADALIDFSETLVGWAPGALAHVNVLVSTLFGGISGIAAADMASIGNIMLHQMQRKGYPKDFSVAISSFSSIASLIIPPSITMIIFGVTANVSIINMFIAGIIPGLVLMVGQIILSLFLIKPYQYQLTDRQAFSFRRVIKSFIKVAPALSIPIIIIGGILSGVFTITESAGFASLISLLLAFTNLYERISIKDLIKIIHETAETTCIVGVIVASATLFARFINLQRIPQMLSAAILSYTNNPILIILIIIVVLLINGCFISSVPSIIIYVPILLPLIKGIGMDPVHFGILMIFLMALGTQTPPVGTTMMLACVLGEIELEELMGPLKYFIILGSILALLFAFIPSISLFLPKLLGFM